MDYISYKSIYRFVLLASLIQISTIYYAVRNQYAYLISVVTIFAVEGAIMAMTPVLVLKIFGINRGPEVYSIM